MFFIGKRYIFFSRYLRFYDNFSFAPPKYRYPWDLKEGSRNLDLEELSSLMAPDIQIWNKVKRSRSHN